MARPPVTSDSNLERLRAELAKQDRAVLDAVNARLRLVAELKRYKDEAGIPFVDPEQERRLLERLAAENTGPLSEEGVRELFTTILALTKRELES
jgi:3-deoxy-7-phosphoheptulonate synthase / chorismate mutase